MPQIRFDPSKAVTFDLANGLVQLSGASARLSGLSAQVRQGDAVRPRDWWDGRPFQRVLLDAPCSASGIVRRHPDVRWLRRRSDIATLARRQSEMLAALWGVLEPGGTLLFATCSVFRAEGDQVVERFCARQADAAIA